MIQVSQGSSEAGADFFFVLLLGSPYIAGVGAAVGIIIALLIQVVRSPLNAAGKDERDRFH